jgi:uncharacterized protein YxeA
MLLRYLLLTAPFLFLACKEEIKKSEPKVTDKNIQEQKKTERDSLYQEIKEQKNIPFNLNAEWEGVYSYCIPDERTDEFKSVTCFEISIFKDEVTVDGNTSFCTGSYNIKGNKDEIELRYAGNDCEDHFFKLKKNGEKVILYDFMNPDQARDVKRN